VSAYGRFWVSPEANCSSSSPWLPHIKDDPLPTTNLDGQDRTVTLLWEEYRQANPDGYRYSRFCYLYQRWRSKLDVVLRQEHKAGEKMFVDWAGATIPVCDRHTGDVWQASLFVAALGASSYTWAEATRDQQMESWLRSHVHAFEHFHGIPALARKILQQMVLDVMTQLDREFSERSKREPAAQPQK
jgi:transposase